MNEKEQEGEHDEMVGEVGGWSCKEQEVEDTEEVDEEEKLEEEVEDKEGKVQCHLSGLSSLHPP